MLTIVALSAVLVVSLIAPLWLKPLLVGMGVIDTPNERSSHTRPVIRGMGLAPLVAVAVGYAILLLGGPLNERLTWFVILSVSLASGLLGWIEDSRGLSVRWRASAQLVIGLIGSGAIALTTDGSLFLIPIFAIGIAGYINVANFMDGINGISGMHGIVVGISYTALGAVAEVPWLIEAGLILALAFLGFLPWNLLRGGMFLGDVGSYLLGGGIAIVAVAAIADGVSMVAVLSPLAIYLADAAATLLRRIRDGERWFEAHRTHVYQRITDLGVSHIQTASLASVATGLCAALGFYSVFHGVIGRLLACACVSLVVLGYMFLPLILSKFCRLSRVTSRSEFL